NVTTPVQVAAGIYSGSMTDVLFHGASAFTGITGFDNDDGKAVPDTMGAIGPSDFLEVLNGKVARFSRAGVRLESVTLNSFFQTTDDMIDPRVLFDNGANPRWVASAVDSSSSNPSVMLMVSLSSSASLSPSNWRR